MCVKVTLILEPIHIIKTMITNKIKAEYKQLNSVPFKIRKARMILIGQIGAYEYLIYRVNKKII